MKEEIERILDDCEEDQHHAWILNHEKATNELQKLFLSKQIELLDNILAANHVAADALPNIHNWKAKIKSELKQLQ